MPAVVIFDPDELTITEVNTGDAVNSTDLVEIYSEWKDWLLADASRLGYPPAFRQVGSDPISPIQNLGSTFFLNTGDGWKFKPAEYDHQWEIVGNVFTDPPNERRTAPTDGGFTVEVTFFVSNLVDSAVARLDLNQLLQGVYINPVTGVSGVSDDVGTPTNPVNNLNDAVAIASSRNLTTFFLNGSITLDRNFSGFNFFGIGSHLSNEIDIAGFDIDGCLFEGLDLSGSMTGRIEARKCGISMLSGVDGVFENCGFRQDFSIASNCTMIGSNCFSEIAGSETVNVTMNANSVIQLRNYSGGIELENFVAGNIGSVDLDPGHLILNANCTGGALLVRGIGNVTRNDSDAVMLSSLGLVSDPDGSLRTKTVFARSENAPDLYVQQ